MNQTLFRHIASLIAQAGQLEPSSVHSDDHLIEDLGFDQLALAELNALLLDSFQLSARGLCEPGCQTVREIIQFVERNTRLKPAA